MKLVQGKDYFDLMMEISEPAMDKLVDYGINKDEYIKFIKDCSELGYSKQNQAKIEAIFDQYREELEGVHVMVYPGHKVLVLAMSAGLPCVQGVAAAVLPSARDKDVILFDSDHLLAGSDADVRNMVLHEMEHVLQMRRGELVYENDELVWKGWSPIKMSVAESAENFVAQASEKERVSAEILQKPYEAEAYALHLPVSKWGDYFNDDAIEHIMSNWHQFGSVRAA